MKLVASDFDGTLYRNGTVTEEEKQEIYLEAVKNNGHALEYVPEEKCNEKEIVDIFLRLKKDGKINFNEIRRADSERRKQKLF